MKITIKGKKSNGVSFTDTHILTDDEYSIIDYLLSWDRETLKDVTELVNKKWDKNKEL